MMMLLGALCPVVQSGMSQREQPLECSISRLPSSNFIGLKNARLAVSHGLLQRLWELSERSAARRRAWRWQHTSQVRSFPGEAGGQQAMHSQARATQTLQMFLYIVWVAHCKPGVLRWGPRVAGQLLAGYIAKHRPHGVASLQKQSLSRSFSG